MSDSEPSCSSSDADPATFYALQVMSGEIPAGKWVKLACDRHLKDKAAAERQEGDWRWRPELGNRAIALFGLFKHYKGEWGGQPINLELWQKFIVGCLFGWVHRETGLRRYRNAFIELTRGNGKSTMAAGIALILTFFDNEPGAEGYVFATKKDQAKIVFRAGRQMVLRSRVIREHVQVLKNSLFDESTESKFEPLGRNSDTLDGLRPHVAVGDEIHKHASPDVVEVIESGMGPRRQPLLILVTTAGEGDGTETVYGQQLSISTQVLEGVIEIPEWFAFMASADPDDDWTLVETWIKATPNYGVSVKPDFLRKEFRKALANPAEQPKFRRLYLGQRVGAVDAYFSLADWDACPPLPSDEELARYPSWLGMDLSSRVDITATIQVWRLGPEEIAIRPTFWLPREDIEERRRRDKVPYPHWASKHWIELTDGNTIDRSASSPIRSRLAALWKQWKVKSFCYDPWQAGDMTQALQDEDKLLLVPIGQSFKMLSQPTKDLQALVLGRRVRHDRNPVMRWMMSNARKREDDKGNVMLCKKRSRGRIDGPSALVDTLNQALLKAPRTSSYVTGTGAYIIGAGGARDALSGKEIDS